jgi:hypothetical protein
MNCPNSEYINIIGTPRLVPKAFPMSTEDINMIKKILAICVLSAALLPVAAFAETLTWTGKTRIVKGWIFDTKECEYSNNAFFSEPRILWIQADGAGNCRQLMDL